MNQGKVGKATASFTRFVRDFRSITVSLVFGGGALVLSLVLPFGPPWPTVNRAAAFAAIVTAFAMAVSFTISKTLTRPRLRAVFISIVVALVACLIAYALLHSFFVYDAGGYEVVGGFLLSPHVPQVLDQNPGWSLGDVLRGAEYDPTSVWRGWTVSFVQVSLLLSWLGICAATSAAISAFVVLQYKSRPDDISSSSSVSNESDQQSSNTSSLEVWREKLEFLRKQEAIASDAAQCFTLKKQIEEAEQAVRDLSK